ncbi:CXXC-20-CXXC protein [Vibrio crassostreae]|nr:hypothetical protein EDB37_10058 [Vibrio crassostreae]CAK2537965.1 CXXC-20-CXXC protein [Vibrio crassostreae]CAK2550774.1 CXXC-20-CXXC protein [Vibrio crassostreae]CAK2636611.1 CXXC-20-CXXC protein [Vibrio crassostreae]CAK3125490.1 CXXC-20-CXXC protein [Vibrio crassostreae]
MKKCPSCRYNVNLFKLLFSLKLDRKFKCSNCGLSLGISKWFNLYFMLPPFIFLLLNDYTELGWVSVIISSFALSMVFAYFSLALSVIPTCNYEKNNE